MVYEILKFSLCNQTTHRHIGDSLLPSFHLNTPHNVFAELLHLRNSCSIAVCPRRRTTRGVCDCFCGGCLRGSERKHTLLVTCIPVNQYRAGLGQASSKSCIMTCSNERENSPNWLHLSHISHNKRPFVSSSYSSILLPSSWH